MMKVHVVSGTGIIQTYTCDEERGNSEPGFTIIYRAMDMQGHYFESVIIPNGMAIFEYPKEEKAK
jgi:hypothetical protein